MRRQQIFLVALLVCLFVMDGQAATSVTVTDSPAEPEVLRPSAPKAAPQPANVPPAAAERTMRGNPLWAIPLRQLTATRERPLFTPGRRAPAPVVASAAPPPPPPRPAEKPPEAEPLQLSLTGTVAGGDGAMGIFLDKASGTPLRLKVGDRHKGWTLRSVGRRDVVLAKGMSTTKLAMVTPEPGKSKGPAPANPPATQASVPPPQPAVLAAPAAPLEPATEARMTEMGLKPGTTRTLQIDSLGIFKSMGGAR
ncbi:MAG: general secretion pathway protein GspN [Bradyrhizobium sp.]|nr:general secretion pathway protein GspN [Bradyrhizobium sp.]